MTTAVSNHSLKDVPICMKDEIYIRYSHHTPRELSKFFFYMYNVPVLYNHRCNTTLSLTSPTINDSSWSQRDTTYHLTLKHSCNYQ